ncbi:MAG: carbohydrate porin [Planctomycetota bacterium]
MKRVFVISIYLKIRTMVLVMVVLISFQFVPVDPFAQAGQTGGDYDPVGILADVRRMREKLIEKKFDYRFSFLSDEAWVRYADWNLELAERTGLSYLAYHAITYQFGTQGGSQNKTASTNTSVIVGWAPPWQSGPNQGGFIFDFLNVGQLANTNGIIFSESLGLSSLTNDSSTNDSEFRTFAWHQKLLDGRMEVRAGQLKPSSLFNSNAYASDDMRSFLSTPLSSEPSRTHPGPGVGVILTGEILDDVFLGGALADAAGQGEFLDFHSFFKGNYMTNAYVAWKPMIEGLGQGSYQFAMYSVDATDTEAYSRGFGINLAQDISNDRALFLKYNQSDKRRPKVRKSLGAGIMWTNPFGCGQDWLGLGTGWSEPTDRNLRDEYLVESFWRMQLTPAVQLTPGVQLWFNPSMAPDNDLRAVFTLRLLAEF